MSQYSLEQRLHLYKEAQYRLTPNGRTSWLCVVMDMVCRKNVDIEKDFPELWEERPEEFYADDEDNWGTIWWKQNMEGFHYRSRALLRAANKVKIKLQEQSKNNNSKQFQWSTK